MTGLWRDSDFDDAIMTRLRRDSDYNDAIAACVFPDSISRCAFYCQGVSWEHRWFPWRLNMPNDEVCDQDLSARICACKYVQMRANARVALIDSLT